MTKQEKISELIIDAMAMLENLPCGGIGADGYTEEELDAFTDQGTFAEQDAVYHMGQEVWLMLEKARKLT